LDKEFLSMIEVRNLTKNYGDVRAVQNVSFSVGKEQVLGFLGPNGAGKTTIMKILTGFHFPTSGSALVDGIRIDEDPVEVKKRIGYLPESIPLYEDLTVDEYLAFIAEARLIPHQERKKAVDDCLEACGLQAYRSRKIDTLSKGYRQRTGLAQAILDDQPNMILDEPTNGLDPNQIIEIRSLIMELGKRKTVLLSSHILQEIEAICPQVLIINEGKIAAQGTTEEIAGTMKGGDTWELMLKGPETMTANAIKDRLQGLGAGSSAVSSVTSITAEEMGNGVVKLGFFVPTNNAIGTDGAADANAYIPTGEQLFDWAVSGGLKIIGMNRKKISLEDIFVSLTSDEQNSSNEAPKEVE
jgi:ABC-2 type transport system ATP-binding protein